MGPRAGATVGPGALMKLVRKEVEVRVSERVHQRVMPLISKNVWVRVREGVPNRVAGRTFVVRRIEEVFGAAMWQRGR